MILGRQLRESIAYIVDVVLSTKFPYSVTHTAILGSHNQCSCSSDLLHDGATRLFDIATSESKVEEARRSPTQHIEHNPGHTFRTERDQFFI